MGASLLLFVPRKTIWSHHENKSQLRTTTDDDRRRTTRDDDGRRRRQQTTTDDDGRRRTTMDDDNLYKSKKFITNMCLFLICLPPGRRLLLAPGMRMGGAIGTNICSIQHPI